MRGKTPVVRVNQVHHGCSVISTVTNKGQMRWMVFRGALNASILIGFLRRLIKGAARKIFLILDDLRVHKSKLPQQRPKEPFLHGRFICQSEVCGSRSARLPTAIASTTQCATSSPFQ